MNTPIRVLNVSNVRLVGINKRYCNRRFALNDEYRNQKKNLVKEVWASWHKKPIEGNVWVHIWISTAKDCDAVVKPVLDILQEAGVYKNDSQVIELIVSKKKIPPKKLEHLEVYVCEIL